MNRQTKMILVVTAVLEAVTGAALLVVPSLVGRLLLGRDSPALPYPCALLGIALIALGSPAGRAVRRFAACWSTARPSRYISAISASRAVSAEYYCGLW